MISLIIIILSFYLEGFISNWVSNNGLLVPTFTMISLLLIYPYYNRNNFGFILTSGIIGALYDITYTNTLFLNTIVFLIISLLIIKAYDYINNNLFNTTILSIVIIAVYRIITYFILVILGYFSFNVNKLIVSFYSSILLNIIYTIAIYLLASIVAKRFQIKKMD